MGNRTTCLRLHNKENSSVRVRGTVPNCPDSVVSIQANGMADLLLAGSLSGLVTANITVMWSHNLTLAFSLPLGPRDQLLEGNLHSDHVEIDGKIMGEVIGKVDDDPAAYAKDASSDGSAVAARTVLAMIRRADVKGLTTYLTEHPEQREYCVHLGALPSLYAFFYFAARPLHTPLQYAARKDRTGDVVRALLDVGCRVNNIGSLQVTPLHIACRANNEAAVIQLLQSSTISDLRIIDGAGKMAENVATNDDVRTALHKAVAEGSIDGGVRYLLKRRTPGAQPQKSLDDSMDSPFGDAPNSASWLWVEKTEESPSARRAEASASAGAAGAAGSAGSAASRSSSSGLRATKSLSGNHAKPALKQERHSWSFQRDASGRSSMYRADDEDSVLFRAKPHKSNTSSSGSAGGAESKSSLSKAPAPREMSDDDFDNEEYDNLDDDDDDDNMEDTADMAQRVSDITLQNSRDKDKARSAAASQDSDSEEGGEQEALSQMWEHVPPSPVKPVTPRTISWLEYVPWLFSRRTSSVTSDRPVVSDDDMNTMTFGFIPFDQLRCPSEPDLGSGASGVVRKGYWKDLTVAIKQYKGMSRSAAGDFRHEIRMCTILCECKHPNIITFLGACVRKDQCYMCTEFAVFGSLYKQLYEKREEMSYGFPTVRRWSIEIASGMAFLHSKQILHRDLKSANVLLSRATLEPEQGDPVDPGRVDVTEMICKLCDFGVSEEFQGNSKDELRGSIRWMCPEALKQQEAVPAHDVYSYGACLYELCSRRVPFDHVAEAEIMSLIWQIGSERAKLTVPEFVPAELARIMRRCLDVAANRPSFQDLLVLLQRSEFHTGTCIDPTTSLSNLERDAWSCSHLREMQAHWTPPKPDGGA
eukprot:m.173603 g.173603  ORF g.173603 m.173603 type:complete len:872 (+) comp17316_c0_seq2:241-2856(+)